jgi:ribosomal protein L6P/L9E
LIKTIVYYLKNNNLNYYSNFIKLHLVGLGFKNFILNDELYILVGDCNYIIFKIPCNLKVYCKKNQIYILGNNLTDIWNFSSSIKNIKKLNFYKGKGVLEFKNFKFMQLKVGKKQRFM